MSRTVQQAIQELTPAIRSVQSRIDEAESLFTYYKKNKAVPASIEKKRESAEDQNFFETVGAQGGGDVQKGRATTLQEFVLMFLIASLLLFGVAIAVSTYVSSSGNVGAAARTFGLYLIAIFVGIAMFIRFV